MASPLFEMPETPKLGPRQAYALEIIKLHGPLGSDELGAFIHEHRGRHDRDERCEWCAREGAEVGAALRDKGLVKRRRGAGWVLVPQDRRGVGERPLAAAPDSALTGAGAERPGDGDDGLSFGEWVEAGCP